MENKKSVLITGASGGIGAAIAKTLAQEGYHLSLTCEKNKDMLTDLATELEEK